jgi:hypothetical protein
MHNFHRIMNRLDEFIIRSERPSVQPDTTAMLSVLRNYDGELSVDVATKVFFPSPTAACNTVATMARWSTLTHDKRTAAALGVTGAVFRSSDLLRWIARDEDGPRADYYRTLAAAFDETNEEPPLIDPNPGIQLRFSGCLELMAVFDHQPDVWSRGGALALYMFARETLREVYFGTEGNHVCVDYPIDLLPSADENGEHSRSTYLTARDAYLLTLENSPDLSEVERASIELALQFYPPEDLEMEITLSDGLNYWLADVRMLNDDIEAGTLLTPVGSLHVDHSGGLHAYSSSVDRHPFRVCMPANSRPDEEYQDLCFLVSDRVTYVASIEAS